MKTNHLLLVLIVFIGMNFSPNNTFFDFENAVSKDSKSIEHREKTLQDPVFCITVGQVYKIKFDSSVLSQQEMDAFRDTYLGACFYYSTESDNLGLIEDTYYTFAKYAEPNTIDNYIEYWLVKEIPEPLDSRNCTPLTCWKPGTGTLGSDPRGVTISGPF